MLVVGHPASVASFGKSLPSHFSVYVLPHFGSVARGLPHPANVLSCVRLLPVIFGVIVPALVPSVAEGVVQPASVAVAASSLPAFSLAIHRAIASGDLRLMLSSAHCGVGHEPQSLSDMRRTEARSRDTDRRDGVTDSFHVSLNKVEPAMADRRFNLFTKDSDRAALADEIEPGRPQVAFVTNSRAFSCCAEWLAGAASGPHWPVVGPSGKPERMTPHADAGEEVALSVAFEIIWSDILDAPFVNITGREVACGNQVAQPLRGVGVDLVVIGGHVFLKQTPVN